MYDSGRRDNYQNKTEGQNMKKESWALFKNWEIVSKSDRKVCRMLSQGYVFGNGPYL